MNKRKGFEMQNIKTFITRRRIIKKIGLKAEIIRYKYVTTKYLKQINIENETPLFNYIEIETLNRCNGLCSFCPVNAKQPQRPYAKMEWSLFEKIIKELKELDYDGKINLFSNNEPFLDERILEWMKYTSECLPKAKLIMYTNGSMLNLDKFLETIKYTHKLVIDNYYDTLDEEQVNHNLRPIYDYLQSHKELAYSERRGGVIFSLRDKQEELTSRGGQAPNRKHIRGINAACFYPYKQMIIRPDGKCSLCCSDALGKYTLGDVNEQTLTEIWYGEKYLELRREMYENKRRNLMLCKECDVHNAI